MPPTTAHIYPGALVSLVLKADQRSGRQVGGVVQDLLTRGPSHPHGIKVRLTDGRVGRVQQALRGEEGHVSSSSTASPSKVVTTAADVAPSTALLSMPGLGALSATLDSQARTGEMELGPSTPCHQQQRQQRQRYTDMRLEKELELPNSQFELAAFIRAPRMKKNTRTRKNDAAAATIAATVAANDPAPADALVATSSCPVCNAFEGDATAVSRHVEDHFP